MTQSFLILPDGDVENDGWTFFGASVTKIWEAVGYLADDCGIICPSYRGGAGVSFPIDVTDLPDGAIIDSITVFIRMKTNAGSGPRSVTVNVLSSQNTSRYTTRTLRATSAFTTFEVGTYTRDPLGFPWDIHRLNKLRLRVFCLNNLFDAIRITQLYCQVNFHTRPTATVTSPSGTIMTPSPTIAWTYRQGEGEPQLKADYRIFTAAQVASSTFSPDTAPPVYATTVKGEANSYVLPTSLNPDSYFTYVRVYSQFGAKSTWANRAFTIQGPAPGVPGDDNAGIAGTPGVGVPSVVPDSFTSSAQLKMRDSSNLLSVQQADFEIATDPVEFVGTNCIPDRSTAHAFGNGEASMVMAASSATDMTATSTAVEVEPSAPVTVRAQLKAGTAARTVNLVVKEYDENWTLLATTTVDSDTDATSTWTELVGNHITHASAKWAEVAITVVGCGSVGEAHYADHLGLMYGTNTAWSDGGHQSRNLLTSFLATGDDPAPSSDAWVQANAATTTQRVTATGTGKHGLKTNQMTYTGVSGSLAFRATSSVFTTPTTGTNYTLNKPTGLADNDLMLAFVTSTSHGTITPPTGWDVVNTASVDDGSTDIALWILKRTGLAADPATWTDGSLSASSSRRTAVVVAYSGAAHADEQFLAENVKTDSSGALTHQTQVVNNTDPNAWRVAAFAASDDVSGGTFTANIAPPSNPSSIAFVGAAAPWSSQAFGNSTFRINKPAGVQSGDLMVATFSCVGTVNTVTAPSGWTLVRKTTKTGSSLILTFAVFKRTAGSSEPSSWTGSLSANATPMMTQASAYRNCLDASQQFLAEGENAAINGSSIATATVSNTNSNNWRITAFAASRELSFNGTPSWTSTETAERSDGTQRLDDNYAVNLAMYDSNSKISTGNHSRSGTFQVLSYSAAISWIGIIKAVSSPPAPGPNETERVDNANGSSNPWLSTAVYDSNGSAATGTQSVYGTMAPGSGSAANSMASWIGIIKPANPVVAGTVAAYTNRMIDISDIEPEVLELAQSKVSVTAHFLGSSTGTPVLTLEFFRANQKISEVSTVGNTFDSSVWTKSWAVMNLPAGTTRIRPRLSAIGRAVNDTVQFDRVGVMLGAPADEEEPIWRNGTARPEHPIWSTPLIEYQDDSGTGYPAEWQVLPAQRATGARFDPSTGSLSYTDHTIVPLHSRRYRVQTLSYGMRGDRFASGFGPPSDEATFTDLGWWLKNVHDLSMNLQLKKVKTEAIGISTTNTAAHFQPLGEKYPLVITEGYKADMFTISVYVKREDYAALKRLLESRRTLLLQSDVDHSWWVRPVGDLESSMLPTGQRWSDPIREVKLSFVEVAPEE
ncbi:hypothetical protein [Streptomyces sp. NPDC015131]|uniref:hypothetical protein n=1 Tax=Streptomyces sp. NPDC015131 TaxID=3364941 RepID=UPI0036F940CF